MLSDTQRAVLQKKILTWAQKGSVCSYAAEMWGFALTSLEPASLGHESAAENDDAENDDAENDDAENDDIVCDAIPYCPKSVLSTIAPLSREDQILDLGCLGGYGLFDFCMQAIEEGREVPRCTGLDCDKSSVEMGVELATVWGPECSVSFVHGDAESLPFSDSQFQFVIARLVLPYVDIARCVAECSRVLSEGGHVLVQVHAPSYYLRQMRLNVLRPRRCVYYMRPLLAHFFFRAFRHQLRCRAFQETALRIEDLRRLAAAAGLQVAWESAARIKPLVLLQRR